MIQLFARGTTTAALRATIIRQAHLALCEDGYVHDLSASALANQVVRATVTVHDPGVLCGTGWFDAVFAIIDKTVAIKWLAADGGALAPRQKLCVVAGRARSLLCGERCALNFLQTLSATATVAAMFVDRVKATRTPRPVVVTDTRKTLPGLRLAQKYAARCGGAVNHRQGLADAVLLKENHLRAYGSLQTAVRATRQQHPHLPIEVETENLVEVLEALDAKAEMILLDNFSLEKIRAAVRLINGQAEIEVSGNVTPDNIGAIAQTGVGRISVGAITKHVRAPDMSMRFD